MSGSRSETLLSLTLIGGLLLLPIACASGDSGADAGVDAGSDGGHGADYDPSEAFLLNVPAGTSLCSGFGEGRGWETEMQLLGRIELASGAYVLPRKEGVQRLELVEGLRMGPQAELLMVTAKAGELEAIEESASRWRYVFRKDYFSDTQPVSLRLELSLGQEDQAWPAELVLPHVSWEQIVSARIDIGPASSSEEMQAFALCDLGDRPKEIYSGSIADGSRSFELSLQQGPWYDSCFAAGETACLFFIEARLEAGDFQQTVSDRFRLIYAGNHHNWFDDHLVLLDPMLNDEAAWLIKEPGMTGEPGQLSIMNADFETIETHEITNWTRE